MSLSVELLGDLGAIKTVKRAIISTLPVLLLVMPAMAISGNKLVGNNKSSVLLAKQKRMKFVMVHGLMLTSLAIYLFYQSHYGELDKHYHMAQFIEMGLGCTNLILMLLNFGDGRKLSGNQK